ncbi:MAG TPA: hypothetical protein VGA96_08835 [Fibrella sp.]
MDELETETGPVNPYAKTFFWLWGLTLLALAGFRAGQPSIAKPILATSTRQPIQQPFTGSFAGFQTDHAVYTNYLHLFRKGA